MRQRLARISGIGVCARVKVVAEINEDLGLSEETAQSHQARGHTSYEVETDHLKALVKVPLSSYRSLMR